MSSDAIVKNLIDDKGWNTKLIQDIFWEEESKVILGILLSISRREDKII